MKPTMSFMEAVKTCFSKYATFTGRARRSEFWWFYLAVSIPYWILGIILNFTVTAKATVEAQAFDGEGNFSELAAQSEMYANINLVLLILFAVWGLATLIPILAAMTRRLHDTGKSGKLLFLILLCGVGGLIPLILCIPDGNPAPNQYGPSPKYDDAPVGPAAPPAV